MCSFSSRLASASEHLSSYLDCSDKPVVGTTYKDLHALVDRVAESGFFDAVSHASAEPTAETVDPESAGDETAQATEPEPTAAAAPIRNGTDTTAHLLAGLCCLVECRTDHQS